MGDREMIANVVEAKHASRTERARQEIIRAGTVPDAREKLMDGILALPGVAKDPSTLAKIMLLVDAYTDRREST